MNFNRCKRFAIDSKTVRMKLDTQHKICFTMSQKISTRNIFNQTKWQKSRFEQKKKGEKTNMECIEFAVKAREINALIVFQVHCEIHIWNIGYRKRFQDNEMKTKRKNIKMYKVFSFSLACKNKK